MILLNTFGHRLCMQTLDRPPWGDKAESRLGNDARSMEMSFALRQKRLRLLRKESE